MINVPKKRRLKSAVVWAVFGGILWVITSLVAPGITSVYKSLPTYEITYGDMLYNSGQVAGQMCWIYAFSVFCNVLKGEVSFLFLGEVVGWFFLNLGFFDILDIVFLNPYENSLPKYIVFIVSLLATLIIFPKCLMKKRLRNG